METYKCPLCGATLANMDGDTLHPGNPEHGVTLWCPNDKCPAQEVFGHGESAKKAFDIIKEKYHTT